MAKAQKTKKIKAKRLRAQPKGRNVTAPGNNIRNWRLFRKIELQRDLAELTAIHDPSGKGFNRVTITRLENGECRYNEDHLFILGRALGCAPRDLIGTNPFDAGDIFAIYADLSDDDRALAMRMVKSLKP